MGSADTAPWSRCVCVGGYVCVGGVCGWGGTDCKPWFSSDSPWRSVSFATAQILTEVLSSLLSSSLQQKQLNMNK